MPAPASTASSARFAHVFRAPAFAEVEFSFGEEHDRYGTMIGGGAEILPSVEAFASGERFAAGWAWSVRRFARFVRPDAFLLRADWRSGALESLSLYSRFPREPASDEEFEAAMAAAAPFRWSGPSPRAVAAALQVPGPRGVLLRVDAKLRRDVALYFRIPRVASGLDSRIVQRLAEAVGMPPAVADEICKDVRQLYLGGTAGIVGVGVDPASGGGVVKLNPMNVEVGRGLAFLGAKGAARERLEQVAADCRSLRARYVSYLGARYGCNGFAGWKVYLSVAPQAVSPPAAPRLDVSRTAVPALRLPHY